MTGRAGYSLVELLVATAITLSAMGATLPIVGSLHAGFATEGERADLMQRLRVASDALARDMAMAGAGTHQGSGAGPLGFFAASVFPFRQGALSPDPPGTFRTDTLTVVYVPAGTAAQTTIQQPMAALSGSALINIDAGCPQGDPNCGFTRGSDVIMYDGTAAYDTFRVTSAQDGVLQLQHTMTDSAQVYPAGATIAQVAVHTYFLKTDPATNTYQLMHYDGVNSDAAVVDHVVGLAFEYFGEPAPPVLLESAADPAGPWTTYGPKPPPPTTRTTAYPAGENCVFQLDDSGQHQIPRLPALGNGTTLVPLGAEQLIDGPWCPDELSPHRYDADLLRVRKIGITVRVEAASTSLRGPAGALFSRGGTSRSAERWIADQEIHLEVTPANLNVSR